MTIQIPYRGIIEVVGDHDVGKTIAALQVTNNMKDVVFVDDDVKGEGTVKQMIEAGMEFDDYISLAQKRLTLGNTPTADELLAEVVLPTIEQIKKKKRKVIIWDTWRIVYQSACGHVERNKPRYQNVVDFSRGTSIMIQGLISKVARMIEHKQLIELKEVCDLLVITHHIKDNYVQNVIVGKIPESSGTFSEVCNMRVWLRRNPQSKVPLILFLKRPNVPRVVKGKLKFVNIVPLKITPKDSHESIWDAIADYETNPFESRNPTAEETPTAEELAAISGTLTEEQQQYVKSMIEYQKILESELTSETTQNTPPAAVRASQEGPGSTPAGASDTYPTNGIQLLARAKAELGVDLDEVESILEMKFSEINATYSKALWETLKDTVEVKHGTTGETKSGKRTKTKK